jgi:hypothetical protein
MVEIDKFLLVEGAPNVITIFSHVGWFHDLGIMWAPPKNIFLFIIHTFKLTLGDLGGVILIALFTRITNYPNIIH